MHYKTKTFNLPLIPLLQVSPLQQIFVTYSATSHQLAEILNNLQKSKIFERMRLRKLR